MLLRLGTSGTWSTWGSNLCNLGNLGLMHQPQPHEVGKGSKVCVSTLEGWKMVKLGKVHRAWGRLKDMYIGSGRSELLLDDHLIVLTIVVEGMPLDLGLLVYSRQTQKNIATFLF